MMMKMMENWMNYDRGIKKKRKRWIEDKMKTTEGKRGVEGYINAGLSGNTAEPASAFPESSRGLSSHISNQMARRVGKKSMDCYTSLPRMFLSSCHHSSSSEPG